MANRKLRWIAIFFMLLTLGACGGVSGNIDEKSAGGKLADFKLTREFFMDKKVVIYGDSITVESSKSSFIEIGQKNWVDYLQTSLGFEKIDNYAVSGTVLTHSVSKAPMGSTPENRISGVRYMEQNARWNAQADYAFIAYGTNDFAVSAGMGNNTDDPASYLETNTFRGAVNLAVKTLRDQNPDIKILFLTPIFRSNWSKINPANGAGFTLKEYCEAIMDMANTLEYRAVDMYTDIFGWDNFQAGKDYTNDGLHPNALGHKVMSAYLLSLDA